MEPPRPFATRPEWEADLYDELRALAHAHMRRERPGHILQTTALVHEAWMRLGEAWADRWAGRAHFGAIASRTIRRILVDHARRRDSRRRGGAFTQMPADLHDLPAAAPDAVDILDLEEALAELETLHARQARLVEMRFFGGLTIREAASALGLSVRTADGDWEMARRWLKRRLSSAEIR